MSGNRTATSVIALAICLSAGAPAYAQDTPETHGKVEDIIVTAQKRSENLQNVPIAITAIQGDTASALGVSNTTDLQVATPGLIMHRQSNAMTPTLRGISTILAAAGEESPIAIYLDGVYLAGPTAGVFALNNIERIEVLKGPQGTLFGRNAVGGVINIITGKPEQTPEIRATASFGNYDTAEATFYGTTGISDNVATDLSVYWHRQYDGYGVQLINGDPTYRNKEISLRNKWAIAAGDATDITLAFDFDKGSDGGGVTRRLLPGTTVSAALGGGGHRGGFWDVREDQATGGNFKQWGASATLDHEFGWADFKSISAYRGLRTSIGVDGDNVEANFSFADSQIRARQFTQEFQLVSANTDGIKWIVGLFYLNNRSHQVATYTGTQGNNRVADAIPITNSLAAYGEVTVPLGEATNVTGGLRYTYDQQKLSGATYTLAGALQPNSAVDKSIEFKRPTWRLSIDHQFTPSIMVYGSYNRGFKSGVYNATVPTDPAVKPTTLDAFEVGIKSRLFDGAVRLNASAFYYDVSNIQLTADNPLVVGNRLQLLNAASAKIKGFDFDIEAVPVDNLTLRVGAAYLDSEYQNFTNAPVATILPTGGLTVGIGDASGSELIYSPKWTASASALYEIPTDDGDFNFALNYAYNGKYLAYFNAFEQDDYHIVNASASWTSPDDRFSVRLWGKNLVNAKYFNHIAVSSTRASGSAQPPRTYGITLGFKWGG